MKLPILISIAVIALPLTGCGGMGPNQSAGTFIGALGGAAIGAAVGHGGAGAAIGAVGGAVIGNAVGQNIDADIED